MQSESTKTMVQGFESLPCTSRGATKRLRTVVVTAGSRRVPVDRDRRKEPLSGSPQCAVQRRAVRHKREQMGGWARADGGG